MIGLLFLSKWKHSLLLDLTLNRTTHFIYARYPSSVPSSPLTSYSILIGIFLRLDNAHFQHHFDYSKSLIRFTCYSSCTSSPISLCSNQHSVSLSHSGAVLVKSFSTRLCSPFQLFFIFGLFDYTSNRHTFLAHSMLTMPYLTLEYNIASQFGQWIH